MAAHKPAQGPQPADLAGLVRQAREARGWSMGDVDRATKGVVSKSTISDIEMGRQATLSPGKAKALAQALGVPLARLNAAQGYRSRVPSARFELPERAQLLTGRERALVLQLVNTLLDARREGPAG